MDLRYASRRLERAWRNSVGSASAARRGLHDGRSLEPVQVNGRSPARGQLEQFFDAHTEGPGIWKWRHYFAAYERHLARFVDQPFTFVEIGIYSGGSLPMWRSYFGPEARIIGIDIEPACRAYATDGIEVVIGDQADPQFWATFRRDYPIDVLIDDGGHGAEQQITTIRETLAHINPGGVYACEDIHGRFQPFHSYVDALTRRLHDLDLPSGEPSPLHQHVESVHRYPLLTIIEKPARRLHEFSAPRHGTQWEPFLDHLVED
jgi:hypothetical protein